MSLLAAYRKSIVLWLLAVDYAFVNLAFYVGTQNIVLIKDVSAPLFSILILGVWLAGEVYATGMWRLAPSPLNAPLVLGLGWMVLSFLWSPHLNASVWETGRFACYFVLVLAAIRFVDSWRDLRFLLLVHLWTGAVIMLYGATQLAGADLLEVLGYIPGWGGKAFVSTHGNQNFVAAQIIVTGSMALGYALYAPSRLGAAAALGLYLLDLYGVVASTARGAYIGYALSTLLTLGTAWADRRRRRDDVTPALLRLIKPAAVALAVALAAAFLFRPDLITSPIDTVRVEIVETFRYGITGAYNYVRIIFWEMALELAAEKPITGWGSGVFQVALPLYRFPFYHRHFVSHNTMLAHSEWFNTYADLGIVGAGLLFWLCATIGWTHLRQARARLGGVESPLLAGLAGGILAFLVQTTFDVESRWTGNAVTYWQTVGLLFAAFRLPRARPADLRPPVVTAPRPAERLVGHPGALVIAAAFAAGTFHYVSYAHRAYRADIRLRDNMMVTEGGQPGDDLGSAEDAVRLDPYSLTGYYKLAYSYLNANRWHDALRAYRMLQFFAPNYAQIHLNLSVLFRARGYQYESLWELARATTIEDNTRNHRSLANLYAQRGDYRRAIPHLRRCLQIQYDDEEGKGTYFLWSREEVLSDLADAYLQTGRRDLAERAVRAALSLNPRHVPSRLHLARIVRPVRPAEADSIVSEILAENPNEPEALLHLGEAAFAAGNLRGAFPPLRRLSLILPPAPPGDFSRGSAAQVIHDVARRALQERTPGVSPAEALDMIGWAYALVGRYDQAEVELDRAFAATGDPTIAAHLARIRALRGR